MSGHRPRSGRCPAAADAGQRPSPASERGAALALTAVSLAMLLLTVAVVIEGGATWLTRRSLVTATDAAALAGAQHLVDQPGDTTGACSVAATYLASNAPDAALAVCGVAGLGPRQGRLVVGATDGSGGAGSTSESAAAFGPPLTVSGLRPLALCYDGWPPLRQLIDDPPDQPTLVTVPFEPPVAGACGTGSFAGNFITLDFEGGSRSQRLRDWMRYGFDEPVALDGSPGAGCGGDVVCFDRPYALLDLTWELESLIANRDEVALPVFDRAENDQVHLVGVIRARIHSLSVDGPTEAWTLGLKVDPGLVAGTCCAVDGISGGSGAVVLCAVDPGALAACQPEGGP